ncbi:MAG: NirD/YgiW/YdeI family stress tolerance protein [Microvirgula sp.]
MRSLLIAVPLLASAAVWAGPAATGGFVGEPPKPVTVEQRLNHDNYEFQDKTGKITVEIDKHVWAGQTVAPKDQVEISGEVDKDLTSTEIDVKQLRLLR